ncbi:helix-turn-helix transcriptional regulator [Streptomyces sp. SB3404]|uniref:Helix-turn-helix transcriptional regulator n=2 Tax=Streptomyces boncukensis TaxID=2711219 RepID=A0A6G4WVN0_9ACTN|nr:helix-turn-helix transcriptional regulator [Streptomyces boncukensis]
MGLTAFAARIDVSPSWLSRIERDRANPSPDLLRRIAMELNRERHVRVAIAEITRPDMRRDEHLPADY